MKVIFKKMKYGIGIFLELDMEILPFDTFKSFYFEKVIDGVYLNFNKKLPLVYQEGKALIIDTFRKNEDQLKDYFKSMTIIEVKSIVSNPAHYQVESFIGATILWLNEYFNLKLEMPKYSFSLDEHKFILEK